MTRRHRRQERDWPTLPVPFFGFQAIYEEIARAEWDRKAEGALPSFEFADRARILSALAHPFASADGVDAYPSVSAKAAALFRGIVKNHGLRDGNKRLAVTTMSVFLLANGRIPTYTNAQLYRYALRVARQKGNYPLGAIIEWVRRHSSLMQDEELEVLRQQNRRLLRSEVMSLAFDDELSIPAGVRVFDGGGDESAS